MQFLVDRPRLVRVLEVLAAAARGEYEARVPMDEEAAEDEFIELEAAINLLLGELLLGREQNEAQQREITKQNEHLAMKQVELVRALSTPIIVVWPGVLALPIIGAVEADRAQSMSEAMLERVVSERASHVILDLTGAGQIASGTARSLIRMAHAVRMLGARCILTGISAEIARTLVELHFDAGQLQTLPHLSDALVRVLAEKGQRITRRELADAERGSERRAERREEHADRHLGGEDA